MQRDARVDPAECEAQAVIHDVIHHPQRGFCDAGRELADLDAVELVHVDDGQTLPKLVEQATGIDFLQYLDFQGAELAVGDDEEVAATAGGVEEAQLPELLLKCQERWPAAAVFTGLERPNSARRSSMNSGSITFRIFFSVV